MDTLFLLRLFTGILFATAIPPAISLVVIFYEESKRITNGLKLINAILFVSAILGSVALLLSVIITVALLFQQPVSAHSYNLRNLTVAVFFNVPTWGLLYIRNRSKRK